MKLIFFLLYVGSIVPSFSGVSAIACVPSLAGVTAVACCQWSVMGYYFPALARAFFAGVPAAAVIYAFCFPEQLSSNLVSKL
jgi:hypothetical protein